MSRRYSDDEWLELISECRQSGMSDSDWCRTHNIYTATFYRAISRLRKKACEIPTRTTPVRVSPCQEVVQITEIGIPGSDELCSRAESPLCNPPVESNADKLSQESPIRITTKNGIDIRINNNADVSAVSAIIYALQGL